MTPKCPDCKMDQDECICSSPVSAPEALDWLETELSAISCRYHGDPSYDHDAYWMRGRVEKLLEEARKLFTAPTPPVSEDRKDAEIRQWRVLAHQEHGYVLAENRKQAERIKELESELEESDAIRYRCAHLLAETAVALKGPEKALHRHGWQDLPEVAAKQSAALKLAKKVLERFGGFSGVNEALAAIDDALGGSNG